MNIPNALTLLRIFLVPAFLIAIVYGWLDVGLVIFVGAGFTDLLDGFWARHFGQESRLGRYLDPVADKLLMAVSFIALAAIGLLPAWLTILVVSRDLFLGIGTAILYFSRQSIDVVPSRWGKQTTFLQVVTVSLVLFSATVGWGGQFLAPLYILVGAVTALSGFHYILSGINSLPVDTDR